MSDAVEAGSHAARLLMRDRESLARAVTDALYAEAGERLALHGANGRVRCLEDMHFNVEHLVPAVDLGDADLFARYVQWLHGLLHARGVDTRDVTRCLELLRDEAKSRYTAAESQPISDIIDAGIRAVRRA